MKRTQKWLILSVLVSLIAICLLLSACDRLFGGSKCSHVLDQNTYSPPTCEYDGRTEHWICRKCGKVFADQDGTTEIDASSVIIPAFGHQTETIPAVPATCTTEGWTEGIKCSVCQKVLTQPIHVDKMPHTDKDNDCVCEVCKQPAHHYGEWTVDVTPTCSQKGSQHRDCSVCGDTDTQQIFETSHTYVVIAATEATCQKAGNTMGKVCEVCGEELIKSEIIPAIDHQYANGRCTMCGVGEPTANLAFTALTQNGQTVGYSVGLSSATKTSDIVIPSTYNGLPVTEIAAKGFGTEYGKNKIKITSIVIGKNITKIGSEAFYRSDGSELTSVTFAAESKLKEIGDFAFADCDKLEEINLPQGLQTIGKSAFSGCSALTQITLPSSVTTIGQKAFEKCTALESITVNCALGNIDSIFSGCSKVRTLELNAALANLHANNTLFANMGGTVGVQVTVGKSVAKIADNAFVSLTNLVSVQFAEGSDCTEIGEKAFYSLAKLAEINLEDTKLQTIGASAFYGCAELQSPSFPTSLTSIGASAFENCTALTEVTLGANLTTLGANAFKQCKALGIVNFDSTALQPLTESATPFLTTLKITESPKIVLNVGANVTVIPANLFASTNVKTINFASNSHLETVGDNAFKNCKGFSTLALPNTVTTIGAGAFSGSTVDDIVLDNNIHSIGAGAFENCVNAFYVHYNIANYTGPAQNIFAGCSTGWGHVVIGANVTAIPANMFAGTSTNVTKFMHLDFSKNGNLTTIGSGAFRYNDKIQSVSLPDTVTQLGGRAFADCTALVSFEINSDLDDFSQSAPVFANVGTNTGVEIVLKGITCVPDYLLEGAGTVRLTLENTNITTAKSTSFGCNILEQFNVTDIAAWCGMEFAFQTDNPVYYSKNLYLNGSLVTQLELPTSVTEIKPYVFAGCGTLKSYVFCSSVTKFGKDAFLGCKMDGVVIQTDADMAAWCALKFDEIRCNPYNFCLCLYNSKILSNSTKITRLVIPEGVTSIGDYAFAISNSGSNGGATNGSGNVTMVTLPSTLQKIGKSAFHLFNNVTSLTLPVSLREIGEKAFSGWNRLSVLNVDNLGDFMKISFADSEANPLYFAQELYVDNSPVTDLVIPSTVTEIKPYTFSGLGVRSVTIPEGVTKIGAYAFSDRTDLKGNVQFTSISIPSTVTEIGVGAFYGRNKLASVTFQNTSSCTTIRTLAFSGCTSLESFVIPASVTTVGSKIFAECSRFLAVTCHVGERPEGWAIDWCNINDSTQVNVHWLG